MAHRTKGGYEDELHHGPLLIHDEEVPVRARDAIKAAYDGGLPNVAMLEAAARILHSETDLDCRDVRELVGLPVDGGCAYGAAHLS